MNTLEKIAEIREFLITKAKLDDQSALDSTQILRPGRLDSFGLVALLAEVEQKFGVFPDLMRHEPDDYSTLGGMLKIISEALNLKVSDPVRDDTQKLSSNVVELHPGHIHWKGLEPLFEEMFVGFRQQGLVLDLGDGGSRRWLSFLESVPEGAGCVYGVVECDELIGFGTGVCKILPPYLGGKLVGEITYVYVRPTKRGSGIGRSLASSVEHWLRKRGVDSIELQVLVDNEFGSMFWKSLGFVPELIQLRKLANREVSL